MRAPSVLLFVCCVVLLGQQTPLDRAWALAANGHQTEAVQTLYQLIATQPENAEARLLLGSLLMEAGERDKSIEQLSAAVRLQPRSAQAQNALGEAYSKFSDNDSARAAFEKAVALQPDFGIAQLNLGQLLLTANELTPAAQHLDRAISLLGHTDDAAGAYYLRAKIDSAQSHFREAAAHLEQAVSLRPQFAAAWSDLGQARRAALDTKGALDAFKKTVQADPNDSIAQYRLGAQYLRQN